MLGSVASFHGTSRFIVEGRLGEGGMGVVHRVRDLERDQVVALKTMTHLDAASLLRFKREFRALADISHPNVVQLYELFSEDDQWFFTMELVDGCDLITWVHSSPSLPPARLASFQTGVSRRPSRAPTPEHGTLPQGDIAPTLVAPRNLYDPLLEDALTGAPEDVFAPPRVKARFLVRDGARLRDAFRQLASGVQAIHAAGKLHRDIKPSNVMVTADGRVVLLDFGVVGEYWASRPHAGREPGADESLVGTPAYMAPEQAAFQPATPASDWYAVGVMLYEALTRRMPFEGATSELLLAKQRPLAIPPSALVDGIPPDLEQLCVELLAIDPQTRPSGDQVLRRLEGDRSSPSPAVVDAPFVGRHDQLRDLHEAFDASLAKDSPVVVMLDGRSGMGKSALAARFLASLASVPDVLVLSGRCFEREAVPFKAVDQVVDELSRWLARMPEEEAYGLLPPGMHCLTRLFPVLRNARILAEAPDSGSDQADPPEVRRRGFAALKDLLAAIAQHRSLVLHIDDLQWGDADSVQLLEVVLSPPAPRPLLLVCDHRTELAASSDALTALRLARQRLSGVCDFRDVQVGELSRDEAEELAGALIDRDDPAVIRTIGAEARGSPLFVSELARWANERRDVPSTGGAGEGVALEPMILARVAELSDDARALLEAVSIAGGPVEHAIAERAAGLKPGGRNAAIALRNARFVSTRGLRDDDVLETAHDRIRETVAASLDAGARRARHRALAEAIAASRHADAELAFEHFLAGGDAPSARAFSLRAAAAAAENLAFLRAAALYRAAIELQAAAPDVLHAKLGDALVNAGRNADAADAYMAAASSAPRHEATGLRRAAAEHYLKSGRDDRGIAVLREILDEVGVRYPESREAAIASILVHEARLRVATFVPRVLRVRRAQSLSPRDLARIDAALCGAMGLALHDPLRGADFGLRALRFAFEAGEPVRLGRALALAAGNAAARGEKGRRRADELVRAAQRVAAQVDDPHMDGLAAIAAGLVHFFLGEWRAAQRRMSEADAILRTRCRAVAWELAHAEVWSCNALILSGELRKASMRIPQALDEARARDDLFAATHLAYPACVAHIVADDVDAAWRVVVQAVATNRSTTAAFTSGEFGAFISACSVERYRGDGRAAWQRVERSSPAYEGSDLSRVAILRAFASYERGLSAVCAAAQGHDCARALRAADHFVRRLVRDKHPYAPAMGHLVRAAAQAVRGDGGGALKALDTAIPLLDAADSRVPRGMRALPPRAAPRRRHGPAGGRPEPRVLRGPGGQERRAVRGDERPRLRRLS